MLDGQCLRYLITCTDRSLTLPNKRVVARRSTVEALYSK